MLVLVLLPLLVLAWQPVAVAAGLPASFLQRLVNGNLTGLAAADMAASDVTWTVVASSEMLPFGGTHNGRAAVQEMLSVGIPVTIVPPLVPVRIVSSEDDSVSFVFANGRFQVKGQSRQVGQLEMVLQVVLVADGTITAVTWFLDTYTLLATRDLKYAPAVPVMPGLTLIPPVDTFNVPATAMVAANATLTNWQLPGQWPAVPPSSTPELLEVVHDYYAAVHTQASLAGFFVADLDESSAAEILVSGAPGVLPCAGLFLGQAGVLQYSTALAQTLRSSAPLPNTTQALQGGSVVVRYTLQATSMADGRTLNTEAIDYFQLVQQGGQVRIARLTRYWDSMILSKLVNKGVAYPYPQIPGETQCSRELSPAWPVIVSILMLLCLVLAYYSCVGHKKLNNSVFKAALYQPLDENPLDTYMDAPSPHQAVFYVEDSFRGPAEGVDDQYF